MMKRFTIYSGRLRAVGAFHLPAQAGFVGAGGWSNRRKLATIARGAVKATFATLEPYHQRPHEQSGFVVLPAEDQLGKRADYR
jgi:hypothetical protein